MKFHRENTTITVVNDIRDFRMPFEIYSDYEEELYKYQYYRMNNKPNLLVELPFDITIGAFEEGNY